MHLKDFDLNLVAVFEAVYEERNQSRAAERLGISQPAVSHALTRLRSIFNDPLFQERAMHATSMANDLYNQFHLGLNQIRTSVQNIEQFNPLTSHRHFHIAATYGNGAIRGPGLYKQVRQEAPHVRITMRAIDPEVQIPDLLRQKNIDVAICHAHADDTALNSSPLCQHRPVLLTRKNHPGITASPTLDDLWSLEFVAVHGEHVNHDLVDYEWLKQLKEERVKFEVPHAMLLFPMILETDLVCITVEEMAEYGRHHFDLQTYPLPVTNQPISAYLVWHRGLEWETGNQWLRQHIKALWRKEVAS
jgi:DNA-binding transcriptional LysR family regulator